jgi:hypothetical protein
VSQLHRAAVGDSRDGEFKETAGAATPVFTAIPVALPNHHHPLADTDRAAARRRSRW